MPMRLWLRTISSNGSASNSRPNSAWPKNIAHDSTWRNASGKARSMRRYRITKSDMCGASPQAVLPPQMNTFTYSNHPGRVTDQHDLQEATVGLWKETFRCCGEAVETSLSTYDGLEKTESALIDKLTAMVWGSLPEEIEVKLWTSLVFGASSNAMHSEITRNLFGLQRLITILNDMDRSPEAVDDELLKRTAPVPKPEVGALEAPAEPPPNQLSEMQAQILNSMRGEDVSGRASDKW